LGVRSCAGATGCPYYTRVSEPIEVEEDLPTAGELRWIGNAARARADAVEWHIAFLNMAAAFEELARRYNSLQAHVEHPPQRAVPDGYILKAKDGYVARKPRRSKKFGGWYLCDECGEPHDNPPGPCPRRSKSVSNSPAPTTEIPPAVSESQARSGEARGRLVEGTNPPIYDVYSGLAAAYDAYWAHYDADQRAAVCRWEVGRWGI